MSVATPTLRESERAGEAVVPAMERYFQELGAHPRAQWNLTTYGALASLVVIWAAWMYRTWAHWGSLTVDCGREMYVPWVLAERKMLYRDVWYLYGPAAPYFNSWLFRWFGAQLSTLYWAGSLSALGSALFVYLAGMELSSWLMGWAAGAVVLTQAFHASIFSFPLPYSFASVYGCLMACIFLWLGVRATKSTHWFWMLAAGMVAGVALLLKMEFGGALYIALGALVVIRGVRRQTWKFILTDVAAILPGVALCAYLVRWMISIRGWEFLTQENWMSWPTSFFMRTYGKAWLANSGLSLTPDVLKETAQRILLFLTVAQGIHVLLSKDRPRQPIFALRVLLLVLACVCLGIFERSWDAIAWIFLPQEIPLYVTIAAVAAWRYFLRKPYSEGAAGVALLLTLAALLTLRMLLLLRTWGYSIFYDAPAILAFLLLARQAILRTNRSRAVLFTLEVLLCIMCLTVALFGTRRVDSVFPADGKLQTERGTIKVSKSMAAQYTAAIQFMREKNAQGEAVLSIPEDTSLYFLSGTHCPTRLVAFTPGVVAPGKMTDEVIREVEQRNVRYVLWSNRIFPEYDAYRFGVDFDKPLGEYFRSHYRRVGPASPAHVVLGEWTAFIWERVPSNEAPTMQ